MPASAASLWSAWTRERDASAFEALVRPELPHALGFARRLGCNDADAEDALQDALVQLARVKDDGPIEMGLRAWLCRVVRTRARSHLRSERRRIVRQSAASVGEARAPEASRAAVVEEVEAALASLDADEREAVTLRCVHDLEYRDVALVLGVSEAACRQRVHRGLERLRGRLGAGAPALLAALPLPAVTAEAALVRAAVTASAVGGHAALTASAIGGVFMASTVGKVLLVGAVLAAVGMGALVWRGGLGGASPSSGREHAAGSDLAANGTHDADADPGNRGAAGPRTGPVLRSGRNVARIGTGALVGRVLDAGTTKGHANAVVTLGGTGLGGEPVNVRAETAADGTFRLDGVAAGLDYALVVASDDVATLEQRGVVVRADDVVDVGDLWLGLPGTLVGLVTDASGAGVVGAEVSLHRGIGSLREYVQTGGFMELFANLDTEPEPLALATTTVGGRVELPCTQGGPVTLVVRAPGYQQATRHLTLSMKAGNPPVRVELAPGSELSGRVTDATGAGLPGVRLTAYAADGGLPAPLERAFAVSRADGAFRFTTLSGHGRFAVVGVARGYAHVFTRATAGATDVRVVMRRGATLDLRLVSEATGAPIAGAQVLVAVGDTLELDDFVGGTGPGALAGTLTNASGTATLDVFPGHLQMVIVTVPGYPPNHWDAAGRSAASGHGLKGPADARIGAGLTTVVFRLPTGVTLRGRVLDAGGAPLAGAEVTSPGFLGRGEKVRSGTDGAYELQVSGSESNLGVTARLAGWVQDAVERVDAPPSDAPTHATERTLDIRMRRAVTLSGRVVDAEGRGVSGASVLVRREEKEGRFAYEPLTQHLGRLPGQHATSVTQQGGTYTVDGVPPGARVRVFARHAEQVEGWTEPFDVAGGGSKAPDVVLQAGAALDVRVLDPAGLGLAGARVRVEVERPGAHDDEDLDTTLGGSGGAADRTDRRTGATGATRFELLPHGKVTLHVTAKGFAPSGARVTLAADGAPTGPVTVRMQRGLQASGRVVDPDGRPIEGAQVLVFAMPAKPNSDPSAAGGSPEEPARPELWSNDFDRNRRAITDAHGRWSVPDLPVARLAVQGSKDGYRGDAVPIAPSGEAPDLILAKLPPEAVKRIAELDQELQVLYGRMTTEGETPALIDRLFAVNEERQRLYEGGK